MQRTLMALVCLGLVTGCLAGCGANSQAPGTPAEPTASPVAQQSTPAASAATAAAVPPAGDATAAAPSATAAAADGNTDTARAPTVVEVPTALGGGDSAVPGERIAAAIADLAGRLGIASDRISVVSAEAVSWPDGSLGCPQPGMMYPQVITEGYRVILAAEGKEYAYHGDDRGELFYCENPA